MDAVRKLLSDRAIPDIRGKEETIAFFQERMYGVSPQSPVAVRAERTGDAQRVFAGQAVREELRLSFDAPEGECAYPLTVLRPNGDAARPYFVYISFFPVNGDFRTPFEEIIDAGYGLAVLDYNAVSKDQRGTYDGLMAMAARDERSGWGKIAAWAYAASRVMDYLLTRDDVDYARVGVIGHSRLGKTALWCGVNDERFSMAAVVQSGCGGAALNRGKIGETLAGMTTMFPDWFCGAFQDYAHEVERHAFDQHDLIAAMAPRGVYVCSAAEDEWADPASEYLACAAAASAYEGKGFVAEDRLPIAGDVFHEGMIGYHLRQGMHALAREDWQKIIAYRDLHNI